MVDQDDAINAIMDFLNNDTKKVLLVKGYDNDAKVRAVLGCLEKQFSKGIIKTSDMREISDHINRAFKRKLLKSSIKSTSNYKLGKMVVNISSYVTHTRNNPRGNEETFTVFFPVQTALGNKKRYDDLLDDLKDTKSKKVILITTNEWSIEKWDIENHVDEVYFYSVENDNPQIMINLRNNGAI